MKITLKEKDISKTYSDNGTLIDELAYSAGQMTSGNIYEYDEGSPQEPYNFDYEADLLANTKTEKDLYHIAKQLKISLNANITRLAKEAKLQCGAWVALNNAELWTDMLESYTDALKSEQTESISPTFNTELEKARDDYSDDMYKEWLHGDYRNWSGVLREIRKYYSAEGISYDEKKQEVTLEFNDEDMTENLAQYDESKLNAKNLKAYILREIGESSSARYNKDKAEQEKRKAERERLAVYKAEQQAKSDAERKAKLLKMKLNK